MSATITRKPIISVNCSREILLDDDLDPIQEQKALKNIKDHYQMVSDELFADEIVEYIDELNQKQKKNKEKGASI